VENTLYFCGVKNKKWILEAGSIFRTCVESEALTRIRTKQLKFTVFLSLVQTKPLKNEQQAKIKFILLVFYPFTFKNTTAISEKC